MVRITLLIAGVVFVCQVNAASTVSGTITDYITTAPVADFQVRLIGISPTAITDSARTGIDGSYLFSGVPAGAYQIRLEDSRYAVDSANATIASDTNFSFIALALSHVLGSANFPATLTKAGSPYLVNDFVSPGKPVVISPGAKVVFFLRAYLSFDSSMSAIGTQNDSILFMAGYGPKDTGALGYLALSNAQGVYNFAYCRFERLSHVDANGQTPNSQRVSVEHCMFDSLYRAFLISAPVQKFLFAINRVVGCTRGVGPLGDGQVADTCEVTDNYLQSSIMTLTMRPTIAGKCYVRRNTVMGPMLMDCMRLSTRDTIASNIFSSDSFLFANAKTLFFAYNDHVPSGTMPVGIGINAMKNAKGDSCDAFFNIIKKPLFADSTTGVLLSTSPCIGTGMGGENMGVYQGPGVATSVAQRMLPQQEAEGHLKVLSMHKRTTGTVVVFGWKNPGAAKNGTLSIYSLTGSLVRKMTPLKNQESAQCDLPPAGPGVYVASVNFGTYKQNLKLALYR